MLSAQQNRTHVTASLFQLTAQQIDNFAFSVTAQQIDNFAFPVTTQQNQTVTTASLFQLTVSTDTAELTGEESVCVILFTCLD